MKRIALAKARRKRTSGKRRAARPVSTRADGRKGSADGFALGWRHGYHYGRCQGVVGKFPPNGAPYLDMRVLYVTSGKGVPYSPIDEAIVDALHSTVKQFAVAPPTANITGIAARFAPDLVLALEGMQLPADQVASLRAKGIRTAIWFTDDPYYSDITVTIAPRYDYVFTLELSCIDFYRQAGCPRVFYLPLGVNPNVFRPQHVALSYRKDVSFIGSAFWNRVAFFDRIAPHFANKNAFFSGWWWERLRHYKLLESKIATGVWMTPDQTSQYYVGSQIVINLHRASDDESYNANSRRIPAISLNPRTFEIAACGTLQLIDERADLPQFYVPGREIVTYASPEDLVAKMNHFLHHEEERRNVALEGLHRTLRDHTYRSRLQQLFGLVFPPG